MGKRPKSGQRSLRLPPQSMVASGLDQVARSGEVRSGAPGLLGALLGRAGLQSSGLDEQDERARVRLQKRHDAYINAVQTGPKGRPGRPKGSRSKVAQTASKVWADVTGGQGVVLVDGKPVQGDDDASRLQGPQESD